MHAAPLRRGAEGARQQARSTRVVCSNVEKAAECDAVLPATAPSTRPGVRMRVAGSCNAASMRCIAAVSDADVHWSYTCSIAAAPTESQRTGGTPSAGWKYWIVPQTCPSGMRQSAFVRVSGAGVAASRDGPGRSVPRRGAFPMPRPAAPGAWRSPARCGMSSCLATGRGRRARWSSRDRSAKPSGQAFGWCIHDEAGRRRLRLSEE